MGHFETSNHLRNIFYREERTGDVADAYSLPLVIHAKHDLARSVIRVGAYRFEKGACEGFFEFEGV